MKHRKKMLQYAQDAQVTDAPWEWWEFEDNSNGWAALHRHPDWCRFTKYRRKPQWEIDGKFKIGDRVTFVQKCKYAMGDIDVNGVYTVKGFEHPRGDRYYVRLGNGVRTFSIRDDVIELAPQRLEALSKAVGFDVPMPLQGAPAVGTAVYAPRPTLFPSYVQKTWKGHDGDLRELEMGFLHLHFKDAQIHAKALAVISSPHFCP